MYVCTCRCALIVCMHTHKYGDSVAADPAKCTENIFKNNVTMDI